MSQKKELVAVEAGKKEEVIDFLSRTLGPEDRAWVVCSYTDCTHFIKGHCDIYTVHNVPRMQPGKPCGSYEKRV